MRYIKPATTVIVIAGVAVAGFAGLGHAVTTSAAGPNLVRTLTSTSATTTTTTSYSVIPGASANVNVPAGHTALLDVRFTAESACYTTTTTTAANWCIVRVTVDGVEANPASGVDFAFDSTDGGGDGPGSWESHAIERSLNVGPGAHTVSVEYAVITTVAGLTLRIDDWHMTIERDMTS